MKYFLLGFNKISMDKNRVLILFLSLTTLGCNLKSSNSSDSIIDINSSTPNYKAFCTIHEKKCEKWPKI